MLLFLRKCVVNEEVGIMGKLFAILSAPFDLEFAYSKANMSALIVKLYGKLRSFVVSSFIIIENWWTLDRIIILYATRIP